MGALSVKLKYHLHSTHGPAAMTISFEPGGSTTVLELLLDVHIHYGYRPIKGLQASWGVQAFHTKWCTLLKQFWQMITTHTKLKLIKSCAVADYGFSNMMTAVPGRFQLLNKQQIHSHFEDFRSLRIPFKKWHLTQAISPAGWPPALDLICIPCPTEEELNMA